VVDRWAWVAHASPPMPGWLGSAAPAPQRAVDTKHPPAVQPAAHWSLPVPAVPQTEQCTQPPCWCLLIRYAVCVRPGARAAGGPARGEERGRGRGAELAERRPQALAQEGGTYGTTAVHQRLQLMRLYLLAVVLLLYSATRQCVEAVLVMYCFCCCCTAFVDAGGAGVYRLSCSVGEAAAHVLLSHSCAAGPPLRVILRPGQGVTSQRGHTFIHSTFMRAALVHVHGWYLRCTCGPRHTVH
jgi:hypothetical protein